MVEDDDEELDLLNGISEENGEAWQPANDEDQPEGIQGVVVSRTLIDTDQKYNQGAVPLLEIQEKGEDGVLWSVRGYHTVLRNQIEKHDPQVGDTVAIKYLGVKENKSGDNSYENYGMACPACMRRKKGS